MVFSRHAAQDHRGIRVSLLLATFLSTARMQGNAWSSCRGQAKKSSSPVGARTDIKLTRRDSDTNTSLNTYKGHCVGFA